MLLHKIAYNTGLIIGTMARLSHEIKRGLFIASVSLVIIGVILFWSDIPATLGFIIATNFLLYSFVVLTECDFCCSFENDEWNEEEL